MDFSGGANLFVAGEDRKGTSSRFDVINPYSGQTVWKCATASEQDCDDAVDRVAAFQPTWEAVPPSQKRAIFLKAAELLATPRYTDAFKEALSKEIDASAGWQHVNIMSSANFFREAASQASNIKGEHHRSEKPDVDMFIVQRRAAGVVFGIAPWNAPVNLAIRAIAMPLIGGNTVILKASEYSPVCQRLVVDLLLEAGLPKDAIAFLMFTRDKAPALTNRIIARKEVARINFTGSEVVGRLIAAECGRHLKQCVMELGGKAPVIISNNAKDNLEAAAWGVVFGALMNTGQVCMSSERILVQKEILPEFRKLVVDRVQKLKAGSNANADTQLGPLFNPGAARGVIKLIQQAKAEGAKALVGGNEDEAGGEYKTVVQPTVLDNVTPSMSFWHREAFGPVLAFTAFDTMDEAVKMANDTEFSLIAGIWTSNLHEAMKYAPMMKAGSVQVNGSTIHIEPSFGNAGLGGASGYGRFTIDAFTDFRAIAFHAQNGKFPAFAV